MHYKFDWDPTKERVNVRKHAVSFRAAATVFSDPNQVSVYDEEHSEYENRWVTMGTDRGGVLQVVVHTFQLIAEDVVEIRIISAPQGDAQGDAAIPRGKHMKIEYDFSKGERGKFYSPDAEFSFPVYLEPDVDDFMSKLADQNKIAVEELVNEWLRASIKIIQSISADQAGKPTTPRAAGTPPLAQ